MDEREPFLNPEKCGRERASLSSEECLFYQVGTSGALLKISRTFFSGFLRLRSHF